jgi:hypothetical protein
MRLPYASTHTHVTTVPARLRSNGLHPSSRPHRPCPGADYERRWERGETTAMPYWGRVWEDAAGRGCHSAPCESPTATARCIGDVLAVGPHREHALSQATFWASQALALLLAGRNVHSRLEPKVPKVPPPTSPSCPPGSAWLSAYLPACRCCWLAVRWGLL